MSAIRAVRKAHRVVIVASVGLNKRIRLSYFDADRWVCLVTAFGKRVISKLACKQIQANSEDVVVSGADSTCCGNNDGGGNHRTDHPHRVGSSPCNLQRFLRGGTVK